MTDNVEIAHEFNTFFANIDGNLTSNIDTRNNLSAEQQYGFRQNHSTEYVAVKLVDYISNTVYYYISSSTIFIDLSKAFDALSYDILLYKKCNIILLYKKLI